MRISRLSINSSDHQSTLPFPKTSSLSLLTFIIAGCTAIFLLCLDSFEFGWTQQQQQHYGPTKTPVTPFVATPPILSQQLSSYLPSTTLQSTSCTDVRKRVQRGEWFDPNQGHIYARKLTSKPSFVMSVHRADYDKMRWNSIYKGGYYYETTVHDRFVQILTQNENKNNLVLDVGMNIGYYTQLSAVLGAAVIGFEINPANLVRVCESAQLNDLNYETNFAFFQRGVSNVNDVRLQLVVPRNPGEATLVAGSHNNVSDDANSVSTITLDTFAQEQGWLDGNSGNSHSKKRPNIRLLKIDVEGHEPEIIFGAERLLKSGLVQNVLTEYRDFSSPKTRKAFDVLLNAGYTIVNNGTLLTRKESESYYHDLTRNRYHDESLLRKFRSKPHRFYMDLWFSCTTCQSAESIAATKAVAKAF